MKHPIAEPKWIKGLIVLGALLVLVALNHAILGKERIRRDGEIAYLRLAPVDPRSLIQGDYMALRFEIVQRLERDDEQRVDEKRGTAMREGEVNFASITLDDKRVAQLAAGASPATAPLKLRYRIRDGRVWLGTNAFFFEEGTAERYEAARFGEFRVDRASGEAVLVGLRDETLKAL